MNNEKSCGTIILNENKILLIQQKNQEIMVFRKDI